VTSKQQKFALLTKFRKRLKEKGLDDSMNMYAEQWAADALIESYTLQGCYDLIEYYFAVSASPSWKWFAYNADKVYSAKKLKEEDQRVRAIMREQAKEWLK
jgi:hypothetical protein